MSEEKSFTRIYLAVPAGGGITSGPVPWVDVCGPLLEVADRVDRFFPTTVRFDDRYGDEVVINPRYIVMMEASPIGR